jgi:hypothetical protein
VVWFRESVVVWFSFLSWQDCQRCCFTNQFPPYINILCEEWWLWWCVCVCVMFDKRVCHYEDVFVYEMSDVRCSYLRALYVCENNAYVNATVCRKEL